MKNIKQVLTESPLALIPHANGSNLAEHGIRVANLLEKLGAPSRLVQSGYYHSCYGREVTAFSALSVSQRPWLIEQIGKEAEQLCYLNCVMQTKSFWMNFHLKRYEKETSFLINRLNDKPINVSTEDILNLFTLNFANMIDHIDKEKPIQSFKWRELSLFIQYQELLPHKAQLAFKRSFQF